MGSHRMLLVVIIYILGSIFLERSEATEGLFLATPNAILFVKDLTNPNSGEIVYKAEAYSRIVGLAYYQNNANSLLFWSDISISSRGIYRATIGANGQLSNNVTLVKDDIQEVNCLSVDWVHKNLYWTDSLKKTIEVINFDTLRRRVLISDSISNPRGIYADPENGYLFWNDQGAKNIKRSRLDGSDVREIVKSQAQPNQMQVYQRKLYWVDANTKSLKRSELNGTPIDSVYEDKSQGSTPVLFGLAIFNGNAYITTWTNEVVVVNLAGTNPTANTYPMRDLTTRYIFSAAYFSDTASLQPFVDNSCLRAGCSHLCLGIDVSTVRCSCPSFGGLILPKGTGACQNVSGNILLYALAESGFVGFTPIGIETVEKYFIYRSTRPVGVAYDPSSQIVYWSDVSERMVHKVSLNGKGHEVLLSDKDGLGVVDGMVFDYENKKLYYTHFGSVYVDGIQYSWHRIEVLDVSVGTDQPRVIKTLVDGVQKPRALALDFEYGHLYYTDWSNRARIVRTNLDGSNPIELRSGLDNPNGLALVGTGPSKRLYYVDSHSKTQENSNYAGGVKNGSLYSVQTNPPGGDFKRITVSGNYTPAKPFGLTWRSDANILYASDWDTKSIVAIEINRGFNGQTGIHDNVESPMMVHYTPYSYTSQRTLACSSNKGGCSDVCFSSNSTSGVCSCNSYSTDTIRSSAQSCNAPDGFAVVGDMNSLKLYGLDGTDMSLYTAFQGQPYFSNIVAAVQDPRSKFIFFSDVHSKWIMRTGFEKNSTKQFFRINHIIDGMTVYDNGPASRLYWTDSSIGLIAYIEIPNDGSTPDNIPPNIVLTGLSRPRAIKIYNGFIYWTEWGDNSGKVLRIDLNTKGTKADAQEIKGNWNWVNGLFIDETNSRLYVSDGHPKTKNVHNCTLDGDCTPVPGLADELRHIYDVWVFNGIVYYSDWKSKAVIAYSPAHGASWPVLDNLMRPTQIFLKFPPDANTRNYCSVNNGGCSDICVSLLGSRGCACNPGRKLSIEDQTTCVTVSDTRVCPVDQKKYKYWEHYVPDLCIGCDCLAGSTGYAISGDYVYNSSRCERNGQCPSLWCGGKGTKKYDKTQCCPVCEESCGIKIFNCPSQVQELRLSKTYGQVLDPFDPDWKLCDGSLDFSPLATKKRSPAYPIYQVSEGEQDVKYEVTTVDGKTAVCNYKIKIIDDYAPTIFCVNDTQILANNYPVEAQYQYPTVIDEGGVNDARTTCTPAFGSLLKEGKYNVTCTAWDLNNNSASCSFTLKIAKKEKSCDMVYLNNGHLECYDNNEGDVACRIVCNADHTNTQGFEIITCKDRKWKPEINLNVFTVNTCKKRVSKAVSGKLEFFGRDACDGINFGTAVGFLKEYMKDYLWRSYFPLVSTVSVSGCDKETKSTEPRKLYKRALSPEKKDVRARIDVSGVTVYGPNRPIMKQDVNEIIKLIQKQFNKAFLKLNYIKGNEEMISKSIKPGDMERHEAIDGCLDGTIEVEDGCDVCPAGMYANATYNCVACPSGEYNEWEAQIGCSKCASGETTPRGAYNRLQCKKTEFCSRACIIGLAVGIGGFIILLLILVIIALVIRLRRQTEKVKETQRNFPNNSYEPMGDRTKGEYYDEINPDGENDNTPPYYNSNK